MYNVLTMFDNTLQIWMWVLSDDTGVVVRGVLQACPGVAALLHLLICEWQESNLCWSTGIFWCLKSLCIME